LTDTSASWQDAAETGCYLGLEPIYSAYTGKNVGVIAMIRVCVHFTCLILFVASFSRAASAADRPWIEVKSAHFTVESDAGENTARDIAWQFEQVSAVLRIIWPWATTDIGKHILLGNGHPGPLQLKKAAAGALLRRRGHE
jgi:hypothetical protein